MAGILDATSLDITEFKVGNHCCCELRGHATVLQLQPKVTLPILWGLQPHRWATPDCMRGPSGMVEAAGPISSGSLPSLMSGGSPPVGPLWGPNKGATIARIAGYGITSMCVRARERACVCVCVRGEGELPPQTL